MKKNLLLQLSNKIVLPDQTYVYYSYAIFKYLHVLTQGGYLAMKYLLVSYIINMWKYLWENEI